MIDTAAKRKSAAGVPFLPLGPGVAPDASKPLAWRQQVAWGYSGIATVQTLFKPYWAFDASSTLSGGSV